MIKISQTIDYDFITAVTKNADVWPWVCDDNTDFDSYAPSDMCVYLSVEDSGQLSGYFAIKAINSACYEIHMAILPEFWGRGIQYASALLGWIFSNSDCQKLIAFIPEKNVRMLSLALKSGLKKEGFIHKSFLSGGVLHGQYLLGISKGDICHQQ